MTYLGNTPTTQSFISGTDYFNGDGATVAFTLSRAVVSVNDIEAVVNNVVQQPNTAYTISGTTITFTSAPSAGTSNIYVRYLSTTTQSITPSQGTVSYQTFNSDNQSKLGISFKNRLINGQFLIDQRRAGSSYTPTGGDTYVCDRWGEYISQASKLTFQQQSASAASTNGFTTCMGVTVASAYSIGAGDYFTMFQRIEGYNTADLAWGTNAAKTITISFLVYSSLTGTFGGSVTNSAYNRSYPFTYTINAANTWEQKSVTIPGDTSGTWLTNNGIGIELGFGFGVGSTASGTAGAWTGSWKASATGAVSLVGTAGATWYVTGVQLEVGTQATTFDYRSYGTELALCQRYLPYWGGSTGSLSFYNSSTGIIGYFPTPVPARTRITGLVFSGASALGAYNGIIGGFTPTNQAFNDGATQSVTVQCNYTGLTTGQSGSLYINSGFYMYGTGCEL